MGEKVSFVYVVKCSDGTFYTGWTTDLQNRLKAHNGNVPGGAKYTKSRRPVTLFWYQVFEKKEQAQSLEYHFKKLSRPRKEAYMLIHPSAQLADLPSPEILQN